MAGFACKCGRLRSRRLEWAGCSGRAGARLRGRKIVAHEVGRTAGPIQALACALLAWGLSLDHLRARPHMATLLLFAIWLAAHARARAEDTNADIAAAALDGAVGQPSRRLPGRPGLHGAVRRRSPVRRRVRCAKRRDAACAGASSSSRLCVAAAITPHGIAGLGFPLRLAGMSTALAGIQEAETLQPGEQSRADLLAADRLVRRPSIRAADPHDPPGHDARS